MSVDVHGSLLGFLYGLCFALFRSNVTSKKFTMFTFTLAVIFRSNCSKIRAIRAI